MTSTPTTIEDLKKSIDKTQKETIDTNQNIKNLTDLFNKRLAFKKETYANAIIRQTRAEENAKRKESERRLEVNKAPSQVASGLLPSSLSSNNLTNLGGNIFSFLAFTGAGWIINNLPAIIDAGKVFLERMRIVVDTGKEAFNNIGNILRSTLDIVIAGFDNIRNFDFFDSSKRLSNATEKFDKDIKIFTEGLKRGADSVIAPEEEIRERIRQREQQQQQQSSQQSQSQQQPSQPSPGGQESQASPSSSSTSGGEWQPILNLIAKAESVGGSYDSIYPNTTKPGLSKMTIGEADAWQARTARQRGSAAAGRYQFMYIKDQAALAGIGPNEIFSPENQDKMAIALIEKKRKVTLDMVKNNQVEAARRLAMEWAGLPVLAQTQGNTRIVSRGQSYYAGDGRNNATIKPEELTSAFGKTRQQSQQPAIQSRPQSRARSSTNSSGGLTNIIQTPDIRQSSGFRSPSRPNHMGIDFVTPNGETGWYCALTIPGKVTYKSFGPGYGNFIIIEANGVDFLFAHLARPSNLNVGDNYQAQQPIGEVGTTGRSTGIHLHYEIRPVGGGGGSAINPNPYVKYLRFGKLSPQTANVTGITRQTTNLASNANNSPTIFVKGPTNITNVASSGGANMPLGGNTLLLNNSAKDILLSQLAYT